MHATENLKRPEEGFRHPRARVPSQVNMVPETAADPLEKQQALSAVSPLQPYTGLQCLAVYSATTPSLC